MPINQCDPTQKEKVQSLIIRIAECSEESEQGIVETPEKGSHLRMLGSVVPPWEWINEMSIPTKITPKCVALPERTLLNVRMMQARARVLDWL